LYSKTSGSLVPYLLKIIMSFTTRFKIPGQPQDKQIKTLSPDADLLSDRNSILYPGFLGQVAKPEQALTMTPARSKISSLAMSTFPTPVSDTSDDMKVWFPSEFQPCIGKSNSLTPLADYAGDVNMTEMIPNSDTKENSRTYLPSTPDSTHSFTLKRIWSNNPSVSTRYGSGSAIRHETQYPSSPFPPFSQNTFSNPANDFKDTQQSSTQKVSRVRSNANSFTESAIVSSYFGDEQLQYPQHTPQETFFLEYPHAGSYLNSHPSESQKQGLRSPQITTYQTNQQILINSLATVTTPQDLVREVFIQRQLVPQHIPFQPARMLVHPASVQYPSTARNQNYLGTISAASNQVDGLPDWLNTCLWIEGAPPSTKHLDVLNSIHRCGKIFSLHINAPQQQHATAAAKLAFCSREGASRYISQAQSLGGVFILGQRISVRWNRNKYRENRNQAECRVLRIRGPLPVANVQFLTGYFCKLFHFELINVREVFVNLVEMELEWEFGSILAQAQSAKLAIEREPALRGLLMVTYGRDPCE
jgi:hypothetical protein